MKTILLFLIAALSLGAATLIIQVRNDAGTTISTTTITTSNTVLTAFNNWRLAQILTPAVAESKDAKGVVIPAQPAVLKYPTADALWKAVIGNFLRENVLFDFHPAIIEQRRLMDVANAQKQALIDAAVQ